MNYDRVILELLNRVAILEGEVAEIKGVRGTDTEPQSSQYTKTEVSDDAYYAPPRKDTTQYLFDGRRYGKNRLVLAVIQAYVAKQPTISANELMAAFDKRLQGSLGVVRKLDELKRLYPDYPRRFFASPDEIVHTSTGDCVVCNQWAKFNIDHFIRHAVDLGFEIEPI